MEHVRAYIELAVELGSVIQTTDPEKARQRDRDLIANPTMLRPITPRLGRGLHGNAPPPAATRARQPQTWPTARCSTIGSAIASRCWRRRSLARRSCRRRRAPSSRTLTLVLVVAEGEAAAYLAELGAEAVVIRPDRYILGVASTPAELDAVLARRTWRARSEKHFKADAENRGRRSKNREDSSWHRRVFRRIPSIMSAA